MSTVYPNYKFIRKHSTETTYLETEFQKHLSTKITYVLHNIMDVVLLHQKYECTTEIHKVQVSEKVHKILSKCQIDCCAVLENLNCNDIFVDYFFC